MCHFTQPLFFYIYFILMCACAHVHVCVHVFIHVWTCAHAMACMWRSKDILIGSLFNYMDLRHWTWVIRLGGKCRHSLSRLADPALNFPCVFWGLKLRSLYLHSGTLPTESSPHPPPNPVLLLLSTSSLGEHQQSGQTAAPQSSSSQPDKSIILPNEL